MGNKDKLQHAYIISRNLKFGGLLSTPRTCPGGSLRPAPPLCSSDRNLCATLPLKPAFRNLGSLSLLQKKNLLKCPLHPELRNQLPKIRDQYVVSR